MSEALMVAVLGSVAKIGLDTTLILMKNMKSAKTVDDAIAALEAAQMYGWAEAKAGPVLGPIAGV